MPFSADESRFNFKMLSWLFRSETPKWFPQEKLEEEVKRIRTLDSTFDEKKQLLENLESKIKISSIKKAELKRILTPYYKYELFNPVKITVEQRKGLAVTQVGGEIGHESTATVQTGYTNFFDKGEAFELKGKTSTPSGFPSFTFQYTLPIMKFTDFSLPNPYQFFKLSATISKKEVKKFNVNNSAINVSYELNKPMITFDLGLSMISEDHRVEAPIAFRLDPKTYYKFEFRCNNHPLSPTNFDTSFGTLYTGEKVIPYTKLSYNLRHQFQYGLSVYNSSGIIASTYAVPHSEKFGCGGAPFLRGSDKDGFCSVIGGFPSNSDRYSFAGIDFSTLLFPQYQLNGHFFLNAGVSANTKANSPLDISRSYNKMITAGCGLTFTQGPVRVELNTQIPLYQSGSAKFAQYQIGFNAA